jgi:hypothetical protein
MNFNESFSARYKKTLLAFTDLHFSSTDCSTDMIWIHNLKD